MRRTRALKAVNFCCERCGSKRGLEVHHKTYERLGREWDQDLEVLCDDCHIGEHVTAAEGTPLEMFLKLARQAVAADPFVSFVDLKADVNALCVKHKLPRDHALIEKALAFVLGRQRMAPRPSRFSPVVDTGESLSYAAPCSCQACVQAGVSHERLRRVRPDSDWLHGDDLKRWYAARELFTGDARSAVGARGRHDSGFELLAAPSGSTSGRAAPAIDIYGPVPRSSEWGDHDRY